MTAPIDNRGDTQLPEAREQRVSRGFVTALHAAARAVRLYPAENDAVTKAVAELVAAVDRMRQVDGECALRRVGDYLFVNDTRLRLTLDNFAAIASTHTLLCAAGIGGFLLRAPAAPRDWIVLLGAVQALGAQAAADGSGGEPDESGAQQLSERMQAKDVRAFEILPPVDDHMALDAELDARERSRRTYVRSIDVTREVISAARLGKSPGLKRVKRAVQGIVDAILHDPSSMVGLTTLREFDDYTFVHSVNVCILSVALGRRLGLQRVQLLDLGLAALMHDIGKSRVPLDVLNKRTPLDERDREILRTHPWQGALALYQLPTIGARPWRAMIAAQEHHRRIDDTGYPETRVPRPLSLFSRIIAICDGYDAATTTRVYQPRPWSPADVLRGMRDNTRLGFDPVLVKAFINLTGIYPIGTVVVLDSFELALVHATSTDPAGLSRPIVRLLSDAQGNLRPDAPLFDLMSRDANDEFQRTIIRTEDPERYGIRVSDYLA